MNGVVLDQAACSKIGPRHVGDARGAAIGPGHRQEPPLIRDERKRAQKNALNPTEDRGVAANTKRQAQDRQEGKSGTAAQHAETVPKVLDHGSNTRPKARSRRLGIATVDDQTAQRIKPGQCIAAVGRFLSPISSSNRC